MACQLVSAYHREPNTNSSISTEDKPVAIKWPVDIDMLATKQHWHRQYRTANSFPQIAVVGCGAVVEQCHVAVLKQLGRALSALLDTSSMCRRAVIDLLETAPVEGDDPIAVVEPFGAALVATPQSLHKWLWIDLLRAGKHSHILTQTRYLTPRFQLSTKPRQVQTLGRRHGACDTEGARL